MIAITQANPTSAAATPTAAPGRKSESERSLVRAATRGSRAAANELVRRHWHDSYKAAYLILANREQAEDVAQDSLMAALRTMNRFHPNRPFGPWLRRIVVNRSIDALRAEKRAQQADGEIRRLSPNSSGEPGFVTDPDLASAVIALPLEQRTVVVMRFVLGFKTGEISRILGVARGTVGSRLRRGLDNLRIHYEGTSHESN